MKPTIKIIIAFYILMQCSLIHSQYLQWKAQYHGTSTSSDNYALAIAVDNSGNCYVTGYNSDNLIATVMYNSSGTQEWVSTYGQGNGITPKKETHR